MAEVFKRKIIGLLKDADYEPLKLSQLAKTLGVRPEDYPQFKQAFDQLRQAGHVVIGAGNVVTVPAMAGQIVGRFRGNARGFGFVIPLEAHAHADLFIPPGQSGDAMTGDIVLAKIHSKKIHRGQTRQVGQIVEVLQRARNQFVGTLVKEPHGWFVQPDGPGFFEPIYVDDVSAKNARENDKVVVEILSYPTEKYLARGVLVEVLGRRGHYETEIKSIIRQYHLPTDFSQDCLEQARRAAQAFDPNICSDREDATDKLVITIDPADAKDFDDAISLETDSRGRWVLGVHIADVGYFISPGSPLDQEAKDRGNSVYLPGRTIPMLPEILSNGICSLQPRQKRFVKSVYLTYDRQGNVVARRFANSVFCSRQRLTYEQADRILQGDAKDTDPAVVQLLSRMEQLARRIERRRFKQGMLHLELPEIELVMDSSGRVVDARPADTSYPHTIIEMFMVEANEAVASLLDRLNLPFIRRIHPEPSPSSLKNLATLMRSAFGIHLSVEPSRHDLQQLLRRLKNADCALAVNLAVLRSLEKAQYAPLHIGHYALASNHYCHFTSPIRRYADLLVHRVLECYLQDQQKAAKDLTAELDLVELGKHLSFTEQRADDAERELTTVLVLEMLAERIGTELECVVTGLTSFGIFAQSRKYGVEGLIRLPDLGPDQWSFNDKTQCIVGKRSGCIIRVGQAFKAFVVSVNVSARQLNLAPVEPFGQKTSTSRPAPSKAKRTNKRRARRK